MSLQYESKLRREWSRTELGERLWRLAKTEETFDSEVLCEFELQDDVTSLLIGAIGRCAEGEGNDGRQPEVSLDLRHSPSKTATLPPKTGQ